MDVSIFNNLLSTIHDYYNAVEILNVLSIVFGVTTGLFFAIWGASHIIGFIGDIIQR